ncbi:MAG TPA: hypothetical protein VIG24_08500, partial [Acidimicrobiia bacterium]
MAAKSRTLKLTYLGDASQLNKTTKGVGNDMTSLGDRVKKVGKALAIGFAAVGAAGLAMGKKLFDAFEEVSTANARVENLVGVMGNFEGQVGEVSDRLIEQAEATARLTGADRNLIKESQAILLTFANVNKTAGEAGGTFDRATQAAVDLAAAGFGSVDSAANQLGKALEDPVRGLGSLREVGVSFTKDQEELIKSLMESNEVLAAQDIILKAIEGQVGGTAEATANGSDRMAQAFGILTESIATALGPAFEFLADKAIAFIDDAMVWWDANGENIIQSFRDFGEATGELYTRMSEFTGLVVEELRQRGAFARLQIAWNDLKLAAGDTKEAFDTFFDALTGSDAESKAITFAGIIDTFFFKPLGEVLERVEFLVEGLEFLFNLGTKVKGILDDVAEGRRGSDIGQLAPGGSGFTPSGLGITPDFSASAGQRQTGNVVVNVTGAIDQEGTARTIERVLTDSR